MINMFLLHLKRCYNTHVGYILTFPYGNITCNISILKYMQKKIWEAVGQKGMRNM